MADDGRTLFDGSGTNRKGTLPLSLPIPGCNSRRKMAALRERLIVEGIDVSALDRIKAPAGLDLGAIIPEEIAMSILAEITIERRRGQRGSA